MSASLIAAAKRALNVLESDLEVIVECHCTLDANGRPRRETLPADVADDVAELEEIIAELQASIAAVPVEEAHALVETCSRLAETPTCRPIRVEGLSGGYNGFGSAFLRCVQTLTHVAGQPLTVSKPGRP